MQVRLWLSPAIKVAPIKPTDFLIFEDIVMPVVPLAFLESVATAGFSSGGRFEAVHRS
jgi:hypothetical protein